MPRSVHSGEYQRLTRFLAAARTGADVTQVQLAARLGRPQSYVSKVERSERRIDVLEFCEIAIALGCEPEVLLSEFRKQK